MINIAHRINYPANTLKTINDYYTIRIHGTESYLQDGPINFFNINRFLPLPFVKIVEENILM